MAKKPVKLAKKISGKLNDMNGVAYAYELDPPMKSQPWDEAEEPSEFKYVIVSATVVPLTGPETYIFGARKAGDAVAIADYGELEGSYRGGLNHDVALHNAGYTVIP